MDPKPSLIVDNQPISLRQALKYLQSAGKLQPFIGDILRQHVLEQEIQSREDLEISPAMIEQAVVDFRLQNQLTDAKQFQEWLSRNNSDYATFHGQINAGFKTEKLKTVIAEARLQEYFIERKVFLDRVVLSRIIVENKDLAEELRTQIQEGAEFEELAREHSITDDRVANGMMGPVSRGTMPDHVRAAIDVAGSGEVVGPLEIDKRWGLFRVEQVLPASLEDPQLRQALQNELFERWLVEKVQKMTVQLQVSE